MKDANVAIGDSLEASEVTTLTLHPFSSQLVTVAVVHGLEEEISDEVSLGASEVTVLVLQPLPSH